MAVAQWLDISAFPWLAQSGQPSPGVQQAFALGFQAKQRALDRELQVRELDMKAEQQELLNTLRREKLQADVASQQGVAALATVMGEASRSGFDQASEAKFWETAEKYPVLMTRPEFKEFTQQFELSRQAKDRRAYLDAQITGRSDLEAQRQENRERLLHERYDRLAELQEDSQEARTLRDEIAHINKLEEQAKRPSTGASRFDLPWTDQVTMKAELDAINKDLFAKPEEKAKRIEAVYRKYKALARQAQPQASPAPKILKFNPDTGKFE